MRGQRYLRLISRFQRRSRPGLVKVRASSALPPLGSCRGLQVVAEFSSLRSSLVLWKRPRRSTRPRGFIGRMWHTVDDYKVAWEVCWTTRPRHSSILGGVPALTATSHKPRLELARVPFGFHPTSHRPREHWRGRCYEAAAAPVVVSARLVMRSARFTNGSKPITFGASATKLDRALTS